MKVVKYASIGWGDDEEGRAYWLLVNSWSPLWGEDGFFRMARGINECEVEATPAAGLPLSARATRASLIKNKQWTQAEDTPTAGGLVLRELPVVAEVISIQMILSLREMEQVTCPTPSSKQNDDGMT